VRDDWRITDLVERYSKRLLHFAMRKGRSPEDAEDVVQQMWAQSLDNLHDVPPEAEWTYLRNATQNVAINEHRRQNALRRGTPEVLDEQVAETAQSKELSPEERTILEQEKARLLAQVQDIYDSFPAETQDAIDRWREGLTYKEIACELDMTFDAVQSRLKRANARYRKLLGPPPSGIDWLDFGDDA
jgi:RNA polymerase sigma-70 factor (ECF subfamily)